MDLKGTRTEQQFRKELTRSGEFIFRDGRQSRLMEVLLREFGKVDSAYVLQTLPDQSEDIYLILVNSSELIKVEVARNDANLSPIVEHQSLAAYRKTLSKVNQIKLAVAIRLGQEEDAKT